MNEPLFDVAIIGAGVTGCAIARTLSRYQLKIALIDQAEDVAAGASRANSAIVHAGYDCLPGTLMARLNVRGNALYDEWCRDLSVPLKRIGTLVVAFSAEEEETLHALYRRGRENGVAGLALIDGTAARQREPALSADVTLALHAPSGAITCPYEMTIACAENAFANGVQNCLGHRITAFTTDTEGITLHAAGFSLRARRVINAAGTHAAEIAHLLGDNSFSIQPRKGEYVLLDRGALPLQKVIFQAPTKWGKGVLVSPTVDGNTFAGPTATDIDDPEDTSTTQAGIDALVSLAKKSIPAFQTRGAVTLFAGVRAQPEPHDFILRPSAVEPRLLHAAGICSPGLSSAPAISEYMCDLLAESGLPLRENPNFTPIRRPIPAFRHMTDEQRAAAIRENPRYGHIICRCETVTEAEIVEAIHRGARSVDGVKRRTRAGMGRCQGGFCMPRVMEILARELHIPMEEVTKSGGDTRLAIGRTR